MSVVLRRRQARPKRGALELGRYLADARRLAGLERRELQVYFGVPVRCVDLIEAGQFDLLANPVHARAYIRCLAGAFGLDEEGITLAFTHSAGGSGIVDRSLACLCECVHPRWRPDARPGVKTVELEGGFPSAAISPHVALSAHLTEPRRRAL